MMIRPSFSIAILFGLLAAGCGSGEPEPATTGGNSTSGEGPDEKGALLIETDKGPVEGALVGSTRTFLGIPYAASPTGALRWKPPAPHEAWTETRKVIESGPACAQMDALSPSFDKSTSEDCLTVNVWTPESTKSSDLPVLVWIHGGAFVLGSGGGPDYDGRVLSETTGAVVVTLNYRLGPLGFLALPDLKTEDPNHPSTGAYGLEDQRAALEWVKANIASFGGDPGKVTLFGESAGGISTCMHMVSPRSKGLFQRAIIESGPCDNAAKEATANAQGETFVEVLGCKAAPDVLACLRSKSTEEVMMALPSSQDILFGGGASWSPVLDGWNLPDAPSKLLEAGSFEKVPTILGSNADEGSLFVAIGGASAMIADEAAFEAFAEKFVYGHGKEVVMNYPIATYGSAQNAATAAIGDAAFVCPTRRAARAIAKAGVPTFLYHFTYAPKGSLFGDIGAFHSAEIKFIFGNPSQLLPQPLTDEELKMSAAMTGYWSRHAVNGDPNGESAAEWPKYDPAKDENIVLDVTISKQAGLKKDLCDMWDGFAAEMP